MDTRFTFIQKKHQAFTLVELMTVICVIGILATVAIPAYRQYVLKAKTAEAYVNIDALGKQQIKHYYDMGYFLHQGNDGTNPIFSQNAPSPADESFSLMNALKDGGDVVSGDGKDSGEGKDDSSDDGKDSGEGKDDSSDEGKDDSSDDGGDGSSGLVGAQYLFSYVQKAGKFKPDGSDCRFNNGCETDVFFMESTDEAVLKTPGSDNQGCGVLDTSSRQLGVQVIPSSAWTVIGALKDLDNDNTTGRCTTIFRIIQTSSAAGDVPKASPMITLYFGQ